MEIVMDSKKPFFSVIVPVYNKGLYIERSIGSILNQTFQDFELIIVCDPSTDNSLEELNKFTDQRIIVYHRDQPGSGGYAARNLGIEKSVGEWIVFLDADDMYYPKHLDNFSRLSKKYPNEKLLASAKMIDENGVVKLDRFSALQSTNDKVFSFQDYLKFSFLIDKPFNMNSVGIHFSLIENTRIFPESRVTRSGDIYTWVNLTYKAKKFAWSNHIGSCTYKDVVGVSKTNVPSMHLNIEMVNELKESLTKKELFYLRKYANKLIRTAYFEQKRVFNKTETSLIKGFYWLSDIKYCFFWSCLSMLPQSVIEFIKKIKRQIRLSINTSRNEAS
jgi:succinoglycan biosynthesis protein ExoO